jgi:hypothetical protein
MRQLRARFERALDSGDLTVFGATGPFGAEFPGLGYVKPSWLPLGVTPNSDLLAAILLTRDELDALKQFGSTRVMSLLGRSQRSYPAPIWSERGRSSVLSMKTMQESILSKAVRAQIRGVRVHGEANQIRLRVQVEAAPQLAKLLTEAPDKAVAPARRN